MSVNQTNVKHLQQGDKFGKLTFTDTVAVTKATRGKTKWRCECGKECYKETGNVTKGTTKSCGKCLEIEILESQKFGKLRIKDPGHFTTGSAKKVLWICDCGRELLTRAFNVIGNQKYKTISCGHCDDMRITKDIKYGKLTIVEEIEASVGSHQKVEWLCDCGKTTVVQLRYVLSGVIKTCNKCNQIDTSALVKYNRLTLRDPVDLKLGSNKRVWWKCDCGNETFTKAVAVTSGRTKSCGKCHLIFRQKFEANRELIRSLRTPIDPKNVPDCCPVALETIRKVQTPFKARCRLCDGEYFPRWSGIRLGVSLTCGCSTSRVSSGQNQVFSFIKEELGLEAQLEHQVGDLVYDVFVPSKNLLIEYNGLRWHSKLDSKKRDVEKYRNALKNNYDFVMFYEDEWRDSPHKIKNFLCNRLGLNKPKSLRPSKVEIRQIHWSESNPLYEAHHYIGPVKSPVNYGVFLGEQLVGCCSFKHPTRQSSHEWELVRMVMDPDFRVHGIWNKIIKQFTLDHKPTSIVSFSDNRLFSGKIYGKIGFKLDGNVHPDYYWVKSEKRYHKSGLRKTEAEKATGKTEYELREAQGYQRIWDLGKKRWVYTPV